MSLCVLFIHWLILIRYMGFPGIIYFRSRWADGRYMQFSFDYIYFGWCFKVCCRDFGKTDTNIYCGFPWYQLSSFSSTTLGTWSSHLVPLYQLSACFLLVWLLAVVDWTRSSCLNGGCVQFHIRLVRFSHREGWHIPFVFYIHDFSLSAPPKNLENVIWFS